MTRLLIYAWFILCIAGCSLSDEFDVDIPGQKKQFVVEGYLMPGYPPEITLIENNLLDDELTLLSLWDAKVTITAGDKVYTLKNIFYR
ncbi:MAG TPA: hypothetical protein VHO90_08125, partial [Bacteroidales bacterium]|nr:hypothetical protein [Bacteroidales bacterium]